MSGKKWSEWVVYEVLPEQGSGAKRCLGASEGSTFVEQDSWIGYQYHVIEHAALEAKEAQIKELVEALEIAVKALKDITELQLTYRDELECWQLDEVLDKALAELEKLENGGGDNG